MVDEEESAITERSPRKWFLLICAAVLVFAVFVTMLVAIFVHYDPFKHVDLVAPESVIDTERRRFYDFRKMKNFTNAEEHCRNVFDRSMLAFPRSYQEEDFLEKRMTIEMDKNGTEIYSKCGSEIFIGLRKSIDAEWILSDGTSALSMPKIVDDIVGDFNLCTKIVLEDDNFYFSSANCGDKLWNCIVCEYLCPKKPQTICYTFWEAIKISDYDAAVQFCKTAVPKGSLASVNHTTVLKNLHDQLKFEARTCTQFGVGNHLSTRYESIKEVEMPYKSVRILNMRKMTTEKYCVTMNLKKQLRWQVAECQKARCFICVRENALPVDTRSKNLPKNYD